MPNDRKFRSIEHPKPHPKPSTSTTTVGVRHAIDGGSNGDCQGKGMFQTDD